jgi:hypothetical protein
VVTIVEIVAACRDAYNNSPGNDPWLLKYIRMRLVTAVEKDDTIFRQDEFLDRVGGPEDFSRMIFRIVVEIYAGRTLAGPYQWSKSSDVWIRIEYLWGTNSENGNSSNEWTVPFRLQVGSEDVIEPLPVEFYACSWKYCDLSRHKGS